MDARSKQANTEAILKRNALLKVYKAGNLAVSRSKTESFMDALVKGVNFAIVRSMLRNF